MAKPNQHPTRDTDVKLYQQGDVLLRTAVFPDGTKPCGHPILARGEATGHAHRLEDASDGLLYESEGTLYLRVGARGATITHEEHRFLVLPPGDYQIGQVREYDHFLEETRKVCD